MFVVGVHYCVQLPPEVKKIKHSLFFSFAKVFSFIFLVPLFWNSQECPISQNIWCLIKTQLTTSTQAIFQGSNPWATLVLNGMFVLGVHYGVQLLPGVKIVKIFSPVLFLSFANTFLFLTFLAPFFWNSQNVQFPKIYDALLKPN